MDGSTHIERAYVSGGSRGHNAQIESEWREKRNAWAKVELAKQALLTALQDLPRPIYAAEATDHRNRIEWASADLDSMLTDLKGDLTGPFLKRVSEAGLSRDDYAIEMEGK